MEVESPSYAVIEQKEYLHEATAGLLAAIHRLLDEIHVDPAKEPEHPAAQLHEDAVTLFNSILGSERRTAADMLDATKTYTNLYKRTVRLGERHHVEVIF